MARDSALLERASASGESVFSVYTWERPTLSLGRNQATAGTYDLSVLAARNVDVVRRPTGGRALLHYREVTYSATAPLDGSSSLRDSYRRINLILIAALRRLGVDVSESSDVSRGIARGQVPCFAAPAEGELVTGGAKLVGSAQLRENGALLQHGSILVEDDQPMITELLADRASRSAVPPAATLRSSLGRTPSVDEIATALFDAVRDLEDPEAFPLEESELTTAMDAHREKYSSEWWTWRR